VRPALAFALAAAITLGTLKFAGGGGDPEIERGPAARPTVTAAPTPPEEVAAYAVTLPPRSPPPNTQILSVLGRGGGALKSDDVEQLLIEVVPRN
jgi:hypothetical protein